jgi:hypothetical protein
MTVFVYVNTSKQVGDPEHIKVFATTKAAETWFEENDAEGVALSMRFWNERGRQLGGLIRPKYAHRNRIRMLE